MQPQIAVTWLWLRVPVLLLRVFLRTGLNMRMSFPGWGANIKVEGNSAIIDGVRKLTGARVSAPDLRAGLQLW